VAAEPAPEAPADSGGGSDLIERIADSPLDPLLKVYAPRQTRAHERITGIRFTDELFLGWAVGRRCMCTPFYRSGIRHHIPVKKIDCSNGTHFS
jgi:hypothetical protein